MISSGVKLCAVDGEISCCLKLPGEDCFTGRLFHLKSGVNSGGVLEWTRRNCHLAITEGSAGP